MKKIFRGIWSVTKEIVITCIVLLVIIFLSKSIRKILHMFFKEGRKIGILIGLIVVSIWTIIWSYYFSAEFKITFKRGFIDLMQMTCMVIIIMFLFWLVCSVI